MSHMLMTVRNLKPRRDVLLCSRRKTPEVSEVTRPPRFLVQEITPPLCEYTFHSVPLFMMSPLDPTLQDSGWWAQPCGLKGRKARENYK